MTPSLSTEPSTGQLALPVNDPRLVRCPWCGEYVAMDVDYPYMHCDPREMPHGYLHRLWLRLEPTTVHLSVTSTGDMTCNGECV